jgi:hypothetical protein
MSHHDDDALSLVTSCLKEVPHQVITQGLFDISCRLIKDDYRRIAQECASEGDALSLATGDQYAPLPDRCIKSAPLRYPGGQPHTFENLKELIVSRIGLGKAEVVSNAGGEKVRALLAQRHGFSNLVNGKQPSIHATQGVLPRVVEEPNEKICQGALA